MIDVDGEFSIGNLGDGLWNSGTGCQGCSGDNIKLDKSKIKDTVKKNQDPNDPNNNRRYNTWDGVGCGGCAAIIWLDQPLLPLYYNDWGYGNYQDVVVEQDIYVENGGGCGGACGGIPDNDAGGDGGWFGGFGGGDDNGGGDNGGGWFGGDGGGGDGGGDGGGGCGGGGCGGGCGGGGCGGG